MQAITSLDLETVVGGAGSNGSLDSLVNSMIIKDATKPMNMDWLKDPRVQALRNRMGAPPVRVR
jgi:hypothetical protein